MMKILLKSSLLVLSFIMSQPKEQIEFQLNTISGVIFNAADSTPLMDLKVEILAGNNILKDSTFTDENGYYRMENVGFLWKPKMRFSLQNFQTKLYKLDPEKLDSLNDMLIGEVVFPVPDEDQIPELKRSTIKSRAEMFFIKHNVFYNLKDNQSAERIVIDTCIAIETDPGFIVIKINDIIYDVARCYVPQEGKYENLSYILKSLLTEPIFEKSGNPKFLPDRLLEPNVLFGSIIDFKSGKTIMGTEVYIPALRQRRISDEDGKFAFTIDKPGIYEILLDPLVNKTSKKMGKSYIIIKTNKGGWYKSNQYLLN
ncbi:MAG: carboxypeptidase regulatory-like domain-containing protein [Candidatus Marinimicrobia bacterium]|nr:carboxypeptidase regulatory-like domain-containing protein [Candidatus Neomarinimicrobiota bacterium]